MEVLRDKHMLYTNIPKSTEGGTTHNQNTTNHTFSQRPCSGVGSAVEMGRNNIMNEKSNRLVRLVEPEHRTQPTAV